MDRWRGYLYDGLFRMRDAGALKPYASPDALSIATFASLHGGLVLTQTMRSIRPLETSLNGALDLLHGAASSQ
jgi:hypothetical protein